MYVAMVNTTSGMQDVERKGNTSNFGKATSTE